jgi:hypothetical protein
MTEEAGVYRIEVGTVSCRADAWTGNALTFDTKVEAEEYVRDLANRWLAVTRWRVISPDGTPGPHRLVGE